MRRRRDRAWAGTARRRHGGPLGRAWARRRRLGPCRHGTARSGPVAHRTRAVPARHGPVPRSRTSRSAEAEAEAMGMLHNGHHEWLRSPVGPYLHADEDGRGVSLHPRRASQNAACAVHLFHSDGLYVLPHGSCGRYLAALALASASASPAPTGHRGVQLDFDQAEVEAFMWQVVMSETGDDVLLRNVSGRFLSAIGRYQWHNGSIVDNSTMVVEAIPRRQAMPSLPGSPLVVAFPFLVKGYLNWYGTSRDANEKLKDSNAPVIGMVLQRSHIVTRRGRIIPGRLPRCRSLTCHTSSCYRSCSRRRRSGLTSPLVAPDSGGDVGCAPGA